MTLDASGLHRCGATWPYLPSATPTLWCPNRFGRSSTELQSRVCWRWRVLRERSWSLCTEAPPLPPTSIAPATPSRRCCDWPPPPESPRWHWTAPASAPRRLGAIRGPLWEPQSRVDLLYGAAAQLLSGPPGGAGTVLVAHSAGSEQAMRMAADPRGAALLGLELAGTGREHTDVAQRMLWDRRPGTRPRGLNELLWQPAHLYPADIVGGAPLAATPIAATTSASDARRAPTISACSHPSRVPGRRRCGIRLFCNTIRRGRGFTTREVRRRWMSPMWPRCCCG